MCGRAGHTNCAVGAPPWPVIRLSPTEQQMGIECASAVSSTRCASAPWLEAPKPLSVNNVTQQAVKLPAWLSKRANKPCTDFGLGLRETSERASQHCLRHRNAACCSPTYEWRLLETEPCSGSQPSERMYVRVPPRS